MSVSLTPLNVSAAWSACSLISSAICVSFSKSEPPLSSDRSSPTRFSRSSAMRSTSLTDAMLAPFTLIRFASRRCLQPHFPFPRALEKIPERPEIEVQICVRETELGLELVHPVGQLHERLPEALDLRVVERSLLHPSQSLPLHQLPQQLDERQHELGEAPLDRLGVGANSAWEDVVQLLEPARHSEQVALGGQELLCNAAIRVHAAAS